MSTTWGKDHGQYYTQALNEWVSKHPKAGQKAVGKMSLATVSNILKRAQELKDADRNR